MNIRIFLALIFLNLGLYLKAQSPETVDSIDMYGYTGIWYEIASFPGSSFHPGCHCTTTEYILNPDNKSFSVVNRCIFFQNNKTRIVKSKAQAFPVLGSHNRKMKVQVFWPFKSEYDIIAVAPDFNWMVMSEPGRKYLRILSRDSYMPTHTYNGILQILKSKGFDVKKIVETPRNCDLTE